MSEFIDIVSDARKLQGALKELSIDELQVIAHKLNKIIKNKKAKEDEKQARLREKQAKLKLIKKQMEEAGLDVKDLQELEIKKKDKRKGQKRKIKYILKDDDNQEHAWTGVGRMPKVFVNALDKGKKLEDFQVNK